MRACELKVIDKSIQICYDGMGYKYELPVFVINQPEKYEVKVAESQSFEGRKVTVTFQYLHVMKKQELSLDDKVSAVVKTATRIVSTVDKFDAEHDVVKLVYQGNVWKDDQKVGNYIHDDQIVQVFKAMKR